jgi:hypothetical protein
MHFHDKFIHVATTPNFHHRSRSVRRGGGKEGGWYSRILNIALRDEYVVLC